MKEEIEIKILNIDPRRLRSVIKKLGGKQILRPTLMRELYFKSPSKNQEHSSFRLRSEGKRSLLTLKVKKKDDRRFDIRDEYEVEVSSFKTTKTILEFAGFKVFRHREKKRESYQVANTRIEIDSYPNMNPYAEIESTSKRAVETFIKKMGFDFKYTTKKTATEIIRDIGLNPDNLIFTKK